MECLLAMKRGVGLYATGGTYAEAVLSGLSIKGIGPVSLPLLDRDASKVRKACSPQQLRESGPLAIEPIAAENRLMLQYTLRARSPKAGTSAGILKAKKGKFKKALAN